MRRTTRGFEVICQPNVKSAQTTKRAPPIEVVMAATKANPKALAGRKSASPQSASMNPGNPHHLSTVTTTESQQGIPGSWDATTTPPHSGHLSPGSHFKPRTG